VAPRLTGRPCGDRSLSRRQPSRRWLPCGGVPDHPLRCSRSLPGGAGGANPRRRPHLTSNTRTIGSRSDQSVCGADAELQHLYRRCGLRLAGTPRAQHMKEVLARPRHSALAGVRCFPPVGREALASALLGSGSCSIVAPRRRPSVWHSPATGNGVRLSADPWGSTQERSSMGNRGVWQKTTRVRRAAVSCRRRRAMAAVGICRSRPPARDELDAVGARFEACHASRGELPSRRSSSLSSATATAHLCHPSAKKPLSPFRGRGGAREAGG